MQTATALIIKENKLLVLKKKKNKSHYILPGGKINSDESSSTALIRELKEELSITVKESDLEFITTMDVIAQFENIPMTSYIYRVKYFDNFKIDNEILEYKWLDLLTYDENEVAALLKKLIPYLKKNNFI